MLGGQGAEASRVKRAVSRSPCHAAHLKCATLRTLRTSCMPRQGGVRRARDRLITVLCVLVQPANPAPRASPAILLHRSPLTPPDRGRAVTPLRLPPGSRPRPDALGLPCLESGGGRLQERARASASSRASPRIMRLRRGWMAPPDLVRATSRRQHRTSSEAADITVRLLPGAARFPGGCCRLDAAARV